MVGWQFQDMGMDAFNKNMVHNPNLFGMLMKMHELQEKESETNLKGLSRPH